MDRTRHLALLGQRLHDAAACGDWNLLERAVRELAPKLQVLAAHGAWNASERAALRSLRAEHDRAFDASAGAAAGLRARLETLRGTRDGWIAYALADEVPGEEDLQ